MLLNMLFLLSTIKLHKVKRMLLQKKREITVKTNKQKQRIYRALTEKIVSVKMQDPFFADVSLML